MLVKGAPELMTIRPVEWSTYVSSNVIKRQSVKPRAMKYRPSLYPLQFEQILSNKLKLSYTLNKMKRT